MPLKQVCQSLFKSQMPGGDSGYVAGVIGKREHYAQEEYVEVNGVPIFDAHDGEEEGLDVNFDQQLLEEICKQCNHRIQDTGDLVPITDGHTSEDPSDEDPEILGYAYNFRVGDIGNLDPRKCIFADFKFLKSKYDRAKELPRRSIELWPDLVIDPIVLKESDRTAIDSVSLLGAQRPARNLGLMRAKKNGGRAKYYYEFTEEAILDPTEIIKQCVEAICNTPEFSFLRELMSKQETEAKYGAEVEHNLQADQANEEQKEEPSEEKKDEEKDKEQYKMQRDQERRRYAKLEVDYKTLADKVEQFERKSRVAERKNDLYQLEAEGFVFDQAEELGYVGDMETARYAKHLLSIRKNYQRGPVNVKITPAPVPVEGGTAEVTLTPDLVAERAILKAREIYKK